MTGSHDDNEIIVHFTGSKVVHLSSLVNGFNFPSIDTAGDALLFNHLVGRAIEMLPEDVLIVSGHNRTGNMDDPQAAAVFLTASLEDAPDSKYAYYANYELASALREMGKTETAVSYCESALELNPDFKPAADLLAALKD